LNFIDRIGGIVRPIEITTKAKDNTTEVKIYPGITNQTTEKHDLYMPDSSFKSVIYFEDGGIDLVIQDKRYINYTANLKLIAWYNLPKINEDYYTGDLLTQTIINNIPQSLANSDYLTKIYIEQIGEDVKSKDIFSGYNYNESEWQYLNYPFDYAAINMTIYFSVPRNVNCFDPIIINPKIC